MKKADLSGRPIHSSLYQFTNNNVNGCKIKIIVIAVHDTIGSMGKEVKRLYKQFHPDNYQLHLQIDPEAMTFSGSVIIKGLKVGRPSQRLTFHQHGLKIKSAKIVRSDKHGSHTFELDRIGMHKTLDEVRLHTKQLMHGGFYTAELTFTGKITKTMEGIYPCYYNHDGKKKKLIATQFESHHARQAFPCIDEPAAKATFDLTLITPKGEVVLANTPIKSQQIIKDSQKVTFETSPIMSAYLLAFVHGDMHCVEGKSKSGVLVRSWSTVTQPKSHLTYANNEAIKCLDFFENYFKIPFPLPKLDQAALPDFDSLAMENWGLITFREIGLLADPVNRSISGERLITQVIAHEMSHQWFGDLVTMEWWDDLWLNESFATIMESLAPDVLHPDWQEWEDFTSSRVIGAADRDVYKDVQPVGVHVSQPDEIQTIFDPSIVYAKGARILKMLLDFIGEDAFRRGLESYFKKYAYKNTTRDDLWGELSAASGMDIGSLMTPWIEQSGTPELKVKKNGNEITLSQQRFLLGGEDKETKWPIPLLADIPLEQPIMDTRSKKITIQNDVTPIFNPSGSGHFITHYCNKSDIEMVLQKIRDRKLDTNGRIIAISDMLLLAKQGQFDLVNLLKLVADCRKENRDAVWSMFIRIIGSVGSLTDGNIQVEKALKIFKRNAASYWYEKLGWTDLEDDEPNTKHLRTTALALSIGGEDQAALKIALDRFRESKNVANLPAELRAIIASAAVRFGKPSNVGQLMKEYESSPNPDVKDCIAAALCSTEDEAVGRRIIDWGMFDDNIIKPQDIDHFFAYLLRNRHTREIAWQWLQDRWPDLIRQFGEGKKMEYFIWYASRPMSTPQWQKRYESFFKPMLNDLSLKRNIQISFDEIKSRVNWRQREEPNIVNYLLK
jgi:aminopeptidase N